MSVSETVTFSPFERSVAKKFTSAFKVGVRFEECGRESVNTVVASSAEEGEEGANSPQRRDADQEEKEVQRQVPAGEIIFTDLVLEGNRGWEQGSS